MSKPRLRAYAVVRRVPVKVENIHSRKIEDAARQLRAAADEGVITEFKAVALRSDGGYELFGTKIQNRLEIAGLLLHGAVRTLGFERE